MVMRGCVWCAWREMVCVCGEKRKEKRGRREEMMCGG